VHLPEAVLLEEPVRLLVETGLPLPSVMFRPQKIGSQPGRSRSGS
jgi:hypothetical protein